MLAAFIVKVVEEELTLRCIPEVTLRSIPEVTLRSIPEVTLRCIPEVTLRCIPEGCNIQSFLVLEITVNPETSVLELLGYKKKWQLNELNQRVI